MQRSETGASSPVRVLEQALHTELSAGSLAVVMARAGVGKTAFVVQIGLDAAMQERHVLHVALGQTLEHVQAWYDPLLEQFVHGIPQEEREHLRGVVARHRVIHSCAGRDLPPARLQEVLDIYCGQLGLKPDCLLIDGYDWEGPDTDKATAIKGYKKLCAQLGATLWMTAQTHRSETSSHPTTLTEPCADVAHLIEVAIFLEPCKDHVAARLLKDHTAEAPSALDLQLDCDTLRLAASGAGQAQATQRLPPTAYTLLSGGATGAEAAFGSAAERWGVKEVTFSFPGRVCERQHGLVELTEAELRRGGVSGTYLESHLHRSFPRTAAFQKTVQTIWHQVQTSGEVFMVGKIQPDDTVRGGTGWAAELARHFKKPLHVFDQDERAWFGWDGRAWQREPPPRIGHVRFTGTGTRFLSPAGEEAILDLFQRSFGPTS